MLKEKMRWTFYAEMLWDEYRQCELEGREVGKYRSEIERILHRESGGQQEAEAREMILLMENTPVSEIYSYCEPEKYDEILVALPEGSKKTFEVDEKTGYRKLKGGWYGRMIGCLLGIPVEAWTQEKILGFLRETEQYPIKDYLTGRVEADLREKYSISDVDPGTPYDRAEICWKENVTCIPVDDDVNYPVMALKIVERFGRKFDSADIGEGWLFGFPGFHGCTAERVAYRNLMNGVIPPQSGRYCNPYREWIGAQIRSDFWGYINPGKPQEAARMAYLDGQVSHTGNGIYAEMLIAAIISLGYCEGLSLREIVAQALLQIPSCSRLAEAVNKVCDDFDAGREYRDIVSEIHETYHESNFFDWCYILPNTMLVIAILLYYGQDFDEAVAQAIYCGFDTDCNGATVGSIVGLHLGFGKIDEKWYAELEHKIETSIHGYSVLKLDDIVQRTWKLAR